MADKKISELNNVSGLNLTDLFVLSQIFGNDWVSKNATLLQLANAINNGIDYTSDLQTTSKKPIGAINENKSSIDNLISIIDSLYPVNTASGSIANFTTSLAKPLVGLSSTIVATQSGTGTPSPQNERSISGFSSVKFEQTGKNLFDATSVYSAYEQSDGSFIGTGSTIVQIKTYMPLSFIGKELTFSCYIKKTSGSNITNLRVQANVGGTATSGNFVNSGDYTLSKVTFTPTSTSDFINVTYGSSGGDNLQFKDVQLELGSTATAYEAYNAETKTIALGETVYGGSVDCKNGKATKTVKYFTFSEAQYYGTYGTDNANLYYVEIPDYTTDKIKSMVSSTSDGILISNILSKNSSSASGMKDNEIRTNTGAAPQYFYFRADSFADLTAVNAFLAVTPLQVVAELQTPVEITGLTSGNFTTIAGENNIFSDCGEVSVSFKQTVQEYIDAKIAETQALIL